MTAAQCSFTANFRQAAISPSDFVNLPAEVLLDAMKSLNEAEEHDMHISEAGVLHTSTPRTALKNAVSQEQHKVQPQRMLMHATAFSREWDNFDFAFNDVYTKTMLFCMQVSPTTAVAMATVMNIAIETVNAVAETAMNTVNRITKISLQQLQAVGEGNSHSLGSFNSLPVHLSSVSQRDMREQAHLVMQQMVPTSAAVHRAPAPPSGQLVAAGQKFAVCAPGSLQQHGQFLDVGGTVGRFKGEAILGVDLHGGSLSIRDELKGFRQAGLGRTGARSAPVFQRGPPVPSRGGLGFVADINHPKTAFTAHDMRRRATESPILEEESPFMGNALANAHQSAPPFRGATELTLSRLRTHMHWLSHLAAKNGLH